MLVLRPLDGALSMLSRHGARITRTFIYPHVSWEVVGSGRVLILIFAVCLNDTAEYVAAERQGIPIC